MNIAERIAKRMEVAAKTKPGFVKLSMSKINVSLVDPEKYSILIKTTSRAAGYSDFFKYLGFVQAKNGTSAWRKTFGALRQTSKSWLASYKKTVAEELTKWNAAEGKLGGKKAGKTTGKTTGKRLTVAQLKKKFLSNDTSDLTMEDVRRTMKIYWESVSK